MESNELRIGNYVYDEEFNFVKIEQINSDKINQFTKVSKGNSEPYVSNIHKIPITEKRLKRCEFNFKELGFEDLSVSYGTTSKEIHFVIGNYYKKLDYVHELQNLYFALTKEELKINE